MKNSDIIKAKHEAIVNEIYLKTKAYYSILASEDLDESRQREIPILEDFEFDADGKEIAFNNNPALKPKNCKLPLTKEHVEEFLYCSSHPLYTIRNYFYINNQDLGFVKFNLWEFQEQFIKHAFLSDRLIAKWPRQSGKCFCSTNTITYIKMPTTWYKKIILKFLFLLFPEKKKKYIGFHSSPRQFGRKGFRSCSMDKR